MKPRVALTFITPLAAVGALLGSPTGVSASPPRLDVVASTSLPAEPLIQVAGYGSVWVLTQTEWSGSPAHHTVISRVDRRTSQVLAGINLGRSTIAENVYPLGYLAIGAGSVGVIDYNRNMLFRIDPSTNQVVGRARTGTSPTGLTFSAGSVWVSHQFTSAVWRLDPTTLRVTARIPAGNTSAYDSGLGALSAGSGAVWAVLRFQGKAQRVDTATHRVRTYNVAPAYTCGSLAVVPGGLWIDDTLCFNEFFRYDFARQRVTSHIGPALPFPAGRRARRHLGHVRPAARPADRCLQPTAARKVGRPDGAAGRATSGPGGGCRDRGGGGALVR